MRFVDPVLLQFLPHMPSMPDLLIIAFIGLLIFGKRLPEVGRSLGKGVMEFKKGLQGIEDQIEKAVNRPSTERVLPRPEAQETAPPPLAQDHPAEANAAQAEAHPGQ